jgi:hypothetical protein
MAVVMTIAARLQATPAALSLLLKMLKCTLKKCIVTIWIGFVWLRIGSSDGL